MPETPEKSKLPTWDPDALFVRSDRVNFADIRKQYISEITQKYLGPAPAAKASKKLSSLTPISEFKEKLTPQAAAKLQKDEGIFTELRRINSALEINFEKMDLPPGKRLSLLFVSRSKPQPQDEIQKSLQALTKLLNNPGHELEPAHIAKIQEIHKNALDSLGRLLHARGSDPFFKASLNTPQLSLAMIGTKIQGYDLNRKDTHISKPICL